MRFQLAHPFAQLGDCNWTGAASFARLQSIWTALDTGFWQRSPLLGSRWMDELASDNLASAAAYHVVVPSPMKSYVNAP